MAKFRLLNRPEINSQKAKERQREIEEGKKLARSVDTLREIRSKEEKALEEFRTNSLRVIQEEINAKKLELEALEKLLVERRRELKGYTQPT